MVVTGIAHADAVLAQLPQLTAHDVLAEPSPRDSMAAIALAAAVVEQRHGARVIGSFAADHVIRDPEAFHDAVRTAVEVAQQGYVVTIGITPTVPSTAFGYIELGAEHSSGVMRVAAFTEKPDAATASAMLQQGGYVWNAGMFVVRTDVLLGQLAALQPAIEQGVRRLAAAWDTPDRADVLAEVWPTLTRISIDHAIAEPVAAQGRVAGGAGGIRLARHRRLRDPRGARDARRGRRCAHRQERRRARHRGRRRGRHRRNAHHRGRGHR